jgi:hypothetical protein
MSSLSTFVYPQPFKKQAHTAAVIELLGVLEPRFVERDGRIWITLSTRKPRALDTWLRSQFPGIEWTRIDEAAQ